MDHKLITKRRENVPILATIDSDFRSGSHPFALGLTLNNNDLIDSNVSKVNDRFLVAEKLATGLAE